MNDTSQQVEAGRLGGLAKQRNERNLLAKLKAERPVLDAEVALLRVQKTALIAFAKPSSRPTPSTANAPSISSSSTQADPAVVSNGTATTGFARSWS